MKMRELQVSGYGNRQLLRDYCCVIIIRVKMHKYTKDFIVNDITITVIIHIMVYFELQLIIANYIRDCHIIINTSKVQETR